MAKMSNNMPGNAPDRVQNVMGAASFGDKLFEHERRLMALDAALMGVNSMLAGDRHVEGAIQLTCDLLEQAAHLREAYVYMLEDMRRGRFSSQL